MYDKTHQNVFDVDNKIKRGRDRLDNLPEMKDEMLERSSSLGMTEEQVNKHFETTTSMIRDSITSYEYHIRISEILKDELDKFLKYRDRPITYNTPEDFDDELREMMSRMRNKSEEIFREYLEEDNT